MSVRGLTMRKASLPASLRWSSIFKPGNISRRVCLTGLQSSRRPQVMGTAATSRNVHEESPYCKAIAGRQWACMDFLEPS